MNASHAANRPKDTDRREALAWLGRRLAWEDVLSRLTEPEARPRSFSPGPLRRSA